MLLILLILFSGYFPQYQTGEAGYNLKFALKVYVHGETTEFLCPIEKGKYPKSDFGHAPKPRDHGANYPYKPLGDFGCVGTLITPILVLTAGHCARKDAIDYVVQSPQSPDTHRTTKRIIVHPKCRIGDSGWAAFDVALLHLPVPYPTSHVIKIMFKSTSWLPDTVYSASHFVGGEEFMREPRQTKYQVIDRIQCARKYQAVNLDSMICLNPMEELQLGGGSGSPVALCECDSSPEGTQHTYRTCQLLGIISWSYQETTFKSNMTLAVDLNHNEIRSFIEEASKSTAACSCNNATLNDNCYI